jgi:hypothetical protein
MSILLGACLVSIGSVGGLAASIAKIRARRQRLWPTAPGNITESRVEHKSESFYPVVRYAYEYCGETYVGKKICSFEITGNWRSTADRWVRRYPEGSLVTVFVDPMDPHNAVLEPGGDKKFFPLALSVTGAFVVLGALYLIAS